MRRAILLVAFAAPALAVAADTVTFTEGTNDLIRGPWISKAECESATATVQLGWMAVLVNTPPNFPQGTKYRIYASNKQATTPNCITENSTSTDTFAKQIGTDLTGLGQSVTNQPVKINDLLMARFNGAVDCNVTGDTPVFVCVQGVDSGGTVVSFNQGQMMLQVTPPAAPTWGGAVPADDGALKISWTPSSVSPLAEDYKITATATGDPSPHETVATRTSSVTVTGLTNDVEYAISIVPRSLAGNEGPPATGTGTPRPVLDFWEIYRNTPGAVEQGGCAAGGAGPWALLALAALLAKLRRRA